MLGDRLGERFAGMNPTHEFAEQRPQPAGAGVGREQLQRFVDPRSGPQQQREIGGEHGHVFGARTKRPVGEGETADRLLVQIVDQRQTARL